MQDPADVSAQKPFKSEVFFYKIFVRHLIKIEYFADIL